MLQVDPGCSRGKMKTLNLILNCYRLIQVAPGGLETLYSTKKRAGQKLLQVDPGCSTPCSRVDDFHKTLYYNALQPCSRLLQGVSIHTYTHTHAYVRPLCKNPLEHPVAL